MKIVWFGTATISISHEIEAGGKKVLHMGSLNPDPAEIYPTGSDLLTLPFQAN